MENKLAKLLEISKQIPEEYLEEAIERLTEIKDKAEREQPKTKGVCPHCGSSAVVRNGHKHKKQAYLCRSCGKSFVETTKTVLENSHSSATVWKAVTQDTASGVPLDETAEKLGLSHTTAFNMRHKILCALEQDELDNPTVLSVFVVITFGLQQLLIYLSSITTKR
jgi:transposase-like protein